MHESISPQSQGILLDVPFHTQHWNLGQWHELGFSDMNEADYWQKSSCGILCLQMAIEYLCKKRVPFQELLKAGLMLKAYSDSSGWSHSGLCSIAREYHCEADAKTCSVEDLRNSIDQLAVPVVSIKWALQYNKTLKEKILFWKKYGGHLAVVVGYKVFDGRVSHICLHHTSKIREQNWISREIPVKDFIRGYTGRAIILSYRN